MAITNLINFLRNLRLWVYLSVIYVWFLSIGKLIASLGPPYVIARIADADNSLSFLDLKKAFVMYVSEAAKELHHSPDYVLYSLLFNVAIYTPTLVIGFFVIKKRLWARNTLLLLIILILITPLILGIITSEMDLGVFLDADAIILLLMLYFFTRRSTRELFIGKRTT